LLFLGNVLAFTFQFGQFNDFGQVSFQQTFFLSSQLGQGLVECLATRLELLGEPLAGLRPLQGLNNQLGLREQLD
jgi:hypothetical protein